MNCPFEIRQNRVADPSSINRASFDEVVVATGYIGPVMKRRPDRAPW